MAANACEKKNDWEGNFAFTFFSRKNSFSSNYIWGFFTWLKAHFIKLFFNYEEELVGKVRERERERDIPAKCFALNSGEKITKPGAE